MLRSAHCRLPDRPLESGGGGRAGGETSSGSRPGWSPSRGGGRNSPGRCTVQSYPQIASAHQSGGCRMLAAREEATFPPSLLSLEGSWSRRPPHFAWHEWTFPPPGTASSSPHSSAALTNTVFHTVCLPRHLPSPPCPSPVQHGLGPGLVSFPVRGGEEEAQQGRSGGGWRHAPRFGLGPVPGSVGVSVWVCM